MASPRGPDFQTFIAAIAGHLAARDIPFMLIGGQAVLLHGRPRVTEDVDVTLGVGPDGWGRIRDVCADLALDPLPEHVEAFVRETFVLPARHAETGMRVDFIFSTTPYERQAIDRAIRVDVVGVAVPFATAEDLIIHKLFAGRPRDLEDAVGVLRRRGAELDWRYLEHWVAEFARVPGREELARRLADLRREAGGSETG
ncbi:MAG TPA: nucleotidyl transferase AbiEii/AbiGii toxin family protein [Gemmatimonadales bacterium]|jgi:hypothetical protein|nr:nucleotidyl transferase AbiEii/AbiGii toxin family protein [Gemmatimonadales bacterium]